MTVIVGRLGVAHIGVILHAYDDGYALSRKVGKVLYGHPLSCLYGTAEVLKGGDDGLRFRTIFLGRTE